MIKKFILAQNIFTVASGEVNAALSLVWFRSRACRLLLDLLFRGVCLIQLNQFSLNEFKRQNLVYLTRIVPMSVVMSFENLLERIRPKVGPAARVRVKKQLP